MTGNMIAIIGAQYGSEGKGVVVSSIANEYDVHIRVGSPNAGHTFYWKDDLHIMQTIPCGWINPKAKIVIGRGALINIESLKRELLHIETYFPDFRKRFFIDSKAGILLQEYKDEEGGLTGEYNRCIGSTGEGVGIARIHRIKRKIGDFQFFGDIASSFGLDGIVAHNTPQMIAEWQDMGLNILLEGTQGCSLSLVHGPWPYVTSIDTNASQLLSEIGIAPFRLNQVLIVARTFPIRVAGNSGVLKDEINWRILSDDLGRNVYEETTVTKRARRIGKWDDELIEKAILLNKPTSMALTFIDYIDSACLGISEKKSITKKAWHFINGIEERYHIPISIIGTGGKELNTIRLIDQL
ncbi:adenylosuccinate synthetase [Candidatus Methanomassiliicoccus intestinalis]|uniref:adenylosuccinate synthetase n=1 Tax=Candidatus Methanomassiliicoccus intestinalis TaxID=1406512 RepID=UPI0037DC4238